MSTPFSSYQGLESQESLVNFTSSTSPSTKDLSSSRSTQSQNTHSNILRDSSPFGPEKIHLTQTTLGLSRPIPRREASLSRNKITNALRNDSPEPATLPHSRGVSDISLLGDSSQGPWPSSGPETPSSYYQPSEASIFEGSRVNLHRTNSDREILAEESPFKSKRGYFGRQKDKLYSQFNPSSILHLFDCRPWFYPFTWKKYIVLVLLAGIIAGIVISDLRFHWIEKSMKITRSYMLPVLIISVCAEPIIVFIILPVAIMPNIPQHEIDMNMKISPDEEAASSEKSKQPCGPFETALVIPCHDTDHIAMKTTLDSAFPYFRPQDIYIVDNGRTRHPSHPEGNFREYIRSLHPDIVYMWSPIGSKNAAQLVGALAARNKGYKYIMTVDDDVCMPKNFSAPTEMINEKFKAVAYPIKAMDTKCEVPLWLVAWQDVEYHLSGLSKLAEDRLCGVQFPHGAGWFVELDAFVELMEFHHPMDFIAEDCNAGLGLSKMGKGIRFDARSYLATEVPTTFFGPGLNWWKQRQKSWEMGRHGRLFAFIRHFLWSMPPKKTIQGILWHKLSLFYLICTILIDWLRVPTIVALGRTSTWWRNACLLMLFSALPPLAYNYWKCRRRPDMQVRFWAAVTYPIYKQLYVLVSLFGMIRWAGFFLGGHVAPPTIKEMLKHKDDRCFWLDAKFKENPAWLADEAEAIEAAKAGHTSGVTTPINEKTGPKLDFPLEPPRATYNSPLLISKGAESLAGRRNGPRLSPSIRTLSPPMDLVGGPPSPFVLTPTEREFPRLDQQSRRIMNIASFPEQNDQGSRPASPFRKGAQSPRTRTEAKPCNTNNPYFDNAFANPALKTAKRPGWYMHNSASTLVGSPGSSRDMNRRPFQDSLAGSSDSSSLKSTLSRADSMASTLAATPGPFAGTARRPSNKYVPTLKSQTRTYLGAYDQPREYREREQTLFKLENDTSTTPDSATTLVMSKELALKTNDYNHTLHYDAPYLLDGDQVEKLR